MLDRADSEHVGNSAEAWEKVIVKLRSRAMPPAGMPRPDNATYDSVAAWLESGIDRAAAAHVNPGRTASLHRLNRAEYANAVRDLLAVEVDAQATLPPDEQAFGFENNAEALSMPPALSRPVRIRGGGHRAPGRGRSEHAAGVRALWRDKEQPQRPDVSPPDGASG